MDAALGFAIVLLLGVGSQWIAWKARIPSILILLLCGFLVGPISSLFLENQILDPDAVFGDILLPLVSVSVGLILYEGGLTLRLREISQTKTALWSLCTLGALVTWIGSAGAAYLLIDGLSAQIAILLGAILVVTGPTVIGPLLAHIRPTGPAAPVLKWEGIIIDPIGALLAIIVFEVITVGAGAEATNALGEITSALGKTLIFGGGLGLAGAMLLREVIRRHWAPEFLQNPLSLAIVVLVFVACDKVQKESGLLATTVMGVVLANQSSADVRHIIEFKENLRVLLISTLFITLGSRLQVDSLQLVGMGSVVFVLLLMVVIRPLSVLASTWSGGFKWRDRALVAWMAPRGIVAAAVASVLGLALEEQNIESAELLVPLVFIAIIGTVATYGLTAPWLAVRLGLADQDPQGVVLIGASSWVRQLAAVLHKRGVKVIVIDSNRDNVREARMSGLPTFRGNVLGEHALDELDLTGFGRVMAVTPNDEVNALACQRFMREFGRQHVFQLAAKGEQKSDGAISKEFRGRTLFDTKATFGSLASRLGSGHIIKATNISEEFTYADYRRLYGPRALPVITLGPGKAVRVVGADSEFEPEPGQTLISIVDPDDLLLN